MTPEELLFAKTHEWVHVETNDQGAKIATVGVSAFALQALTDLVHIELPAVGRKVQAGDAFGEIESVKAVSDLYSPVSGEVIAVHAELASNLETLHQDPYGTGWMVKFKLDDEAALSTLLDHAAYQKQCAQEEH